MRNDGGPAFPALQYDEEATGMTMRDYFAAAAMQAFIAEYFKFNGACFSTGHLPSNVSKHSYEMADAMLEARSK